MTFVEFILFIGVVVALYLLMRPLQRYLEPRFVKFFRRKPRANNSPPINITDYKKKE